MKKIALYLLPALLISEISFSQCDVNITGSDFAWCTQCEGSATATPSGGIAPYSYNWSTGDTTANIDSLCQGTYKVTITDNNGCSNVDSVTISQVGSSMSASLNASAASCDSCCDVCTNVITTGGCAPYTYTWMPGGGSGPQPPCSFCPFQQYTVTITDACGCTLTDSITPDTIPVGPGLNSLATLHKPEFQMYPNPSTGNKIISVEFGAQMNQKTTIQLFDVSGKFVRMIDKSGSYKAGEKITFNAAELTSGLYFVVVENQGIRNTKKLVIQH